MIFQRQKSKNLVTVLSAHLKNHPIEMLIFFQGSMRIILSHFIHVYLQNTPRTLLLTPALFSNKNFICLLFQLFSFTNEVLGDHHKRVATDHTASKTQSFKEVAGVMTMFRFQSTVSFLRFCSFRDRVSKKSVIIYSELKHS